MAKDPQTVSKFLSDLSAKLQPIWLKEKEEMLELKKKEASRNFLKCEPNRSPLADLTFLCSAKSTGTNFAALWTSGTFATT